jgi:hypothetical protein
MSYTDDYALPETDPTKVILNDQQPNDDAAKQQLAAALAKRIAEEEDQSGVRSPLRDLFNENGDVGLANAQQVNNTPPPPDSQPLRITVTPGPITNVPLSGGSGEGPSLVGPPSGSPPDLTQDATGGTPGVPAPDLTQPAQPSPDLTRDLGLTVTGTQSTITPSIRSVTGGAQQLIGNALSSIGAAPYTIAAGVAALPNAVSDVLGIKRSQTSDELAQWLAERAVVSQKFGTDIVGLGSDTTPRNPVEAVSAILGKNLTPLKGYTVPATLISSLVNTAFDPAQAKSGDAAKKAQKAKADLEQQRQQEVIETIGGPARVNSAELNTLSGIVLASIGMVFAPGIYRQFKNNLLPKLGVTLGQPKLRPVENAAPGTVAMSNEVDRARTADDANAGALRIARRAGVDPVVMADLDKKFGIQTRANAHSLVDSAIQMGRMETPNFRFQSKVPLVQVARMETPEFQQYMHLRAMYDQLMEIHNSPRALRKAMTGNAGPPTIQGMDDAQILQKVGDFERAHPDFRQLGAAYRDNLKNVRKYMSDGEFGILTKGDVRRLNAEHSNTTVFHRGGVTDDPVAKLGSPTDNLATYMHNKMVARMENEAKGQYIDAMRQRYPDTFKRVTPDQLERNSNWKKNTVELWRRGKKEYYTTDPYLADVLAMDPYYMNSMSGNVVYGLRRMLERTTTGNLAPWFAPTSATRNWLISKYTTPSGRISPSAFGTVYAIPHQLVPRMAKAVSESLDHGSGQWLSKVFGQTAVNNLSLRLAAEFDKSLVAQLQVAGTTRASILEQQAHAMTRLQHASNAATGTARAMLRGYENLLEAIHNAPMYDYARKNMRGTLLQRARGTVPNNNIVDIAAEARHLVGSPKVQGAFDTTGFSSLTRKPIRMEGTNVVSHKLTDLYMKGQQITTTYAPWHNVTVQGMKRIMEAYVNNPAKFTGKLWTYSMLPAASLYYYARSLGTDPNGVDYVDYMMNMRSDYAKQMSMYIPIPGKPAEDGIEVPNFHELAPAFRLMQVAMDHATRSSIFKESEDFMTAAKSFLSIAVEPPMPPAINVGLASQGYTAPMGAFMGESYQRKTDPFDQTGGLPSSLDLYARAVGGGVAEIVGQGYAAATQTPDGYLAAAKNAMTQMGKRLVQKTPYVRDILNEHAPATGNTPIMEAMFAKQKAVDNLVRYFQNYGMTGQAKINTKPASRSGGEVADLILGEALPAQMAGIHQPPPTNPLYIKYMEMLRDAVKKDALIDSKGLVSGGMGFRSLWRRYGDMSKEIRSTRNINAGNYVTWQKQLEKFSPDTKHALEEYGVDTKNPSAVRNFLQHKRQDAGRHILFALRAIERQMSEQEGRPIRIEDLDPYGKGGIVGQDTGSVLPDPILENEMFNNAEPSALPAPGSIVTLP